jgi:hypothetical protein
MKIRLLLTYSFILFFLNGFSQTILKAKIVAEGNNLEGITVFNSTNKKSTTTQKFGYFDIEAKPNDVLFVSGLQVIGKQINLTETDFTSVLIIHLEAKINKLNEVKIQNYNHINAVSMGIVSKDVKSFTPAERRLSSATSGIGIVQFLNLINGTKKRLKLELELEKKEFMIQKLNTLFKDEFYVNELKIPFDYINGFKYYAVEDEKLQINLKSKNKAFIKLTLMQISLEYKTNSLPKE